MGTRLRDYPSTATIVLEKLTLTLSESALTVGECLARSATEPDGTSHMLLEPLSEMAERELERILELPGVARACAALAGEGEPAIRVIESPGETTLERALRAEAPLPHIALRLIDSLARLLDALHSSGLGLSTLDPALFTLTPEATARFEHPHLLLSSAGMEQRQVPPESRTEFMEALRQENRRALSTFAWRLYAGQPLPASGKLPPLRLFNPTLPHGIETLLLAGMSEAWPFADCSTWARELQRCATGSGSAPTSLAAAGATEIGRQKRLRIAENQDAFFVGVDPRSSRALLLVADGISTADVGTGAYPAQCLQDAAAIAWGEPVGGAIRSFRGALPKHFASQVLDSIFDAGQAQVFAWLKQPSFLGQITPETHLPGSTVTAAMLDGDRVTLGHIGDSRAYLLRDGVLEQVSVDHDLQNTLFKAGIDSAHRSESALKALTRSIGHFPIDDEGILSYVKPEAEHLTFTLNAGDRLLLCSDGLPDCFGDRELELLTALLGEGDEPAEIASRLCRTADELLGGDNITAIVMLAR